MPMDNINASTQAWLHPRASLTHTRDTQDPSCQVLGHRPEMREHFVVSKGHTVASYSASSLAQEQTDTKARIRTVDYLSFSDSLLTFQPITKEETEDNGTLLPLFFSCKFSLMLSKELS